jgi:hypothetical protein
MLLDNFLDDEIMRVVDAVLQYVDCIIFGEVDEANALAALRVASGLVERVFRFSA